MRSDSTVLYSLAVFCILFQYKSVLAEPWPYPMEKTIIGHLIFLGFPEKERGREFDGLEFEVKGWQSDVLEQAFERYREILTNPANHMEYEMEVQAPGKLMDVSNRIEKIVVYVQSYDQTLDIYTSETYSLRIDSPTIVITSQTVYGALRGLETLAQSCHVLTRVEHDIDDRTASSIAGEDAQKNRHHHHHHHHHHRRAVFRNVIVLNETAIYDSPRFRHRGLLIDIARHYLPVDLIKQHLDAMVMAKLNVMHIHFSDDQSFPFKGKAVPELGDSGAFSTRMQYTPEMIEEIVTYARLRGIRVVPEFDSPGHTGAFAKSHPEIMALCDGSNQQQKYPAMSPAVDKSYEILWQLFREVSTLFPDRAIHFGGDEIDDTCWLQNDAIREWMRKKGFGESTSLAFQYHISQLMAFSSSLGKVPTLWGDVFDRLMSNRDTNVLNLPATTIIQVWKWSDNMSNRMQKINTTFWLEELKRITTTHRAILSSPWYINLAPLGSGSWEQYWSVEPLAFSADIDQKDRVLGGEAAAWGEHIDATNSISSTWPLAAAVGERLWSPASLTDKNSAKRRIHRVRCRMIARGIPAAPTEPSQCPLIYPDDDIVQHTQDEQVSVI
eukprot:jgi/Picsp_1/910/NSC_04395-R1_hexosaminidase b